MPTFQYEAMDNTGLEIKETIDATSEAEAQQFIKEKGFFVTKIQEKVVRKKRGTQKKKTTGKKRKAAARPRFWHLLWLTPTIACVVFVVLIAGALGVRQLIIIVREHQQPEQVAGQSGDEEGTEQVPSRTAPNKGEPDKTSAQLAEISLGESRTLVESRCSRARPDPTYCESARSGATTGPASPTSVRGTAKNSSPYALVAGIRI